MIFETAEMHMKKAYAQISEVKSSVDTNVEKSTMTSMTEQQLDAANNVYGIEGHLQKYRAIK